MTGDTSKKKLAERQSHYMKHAQNEGVVLDGYRLGEPINKFKSRLQLLHTLRDAVKHHRSLWKAGILHGNISASSILLSSLEDSKESHAVLVDFDLSVPTTPSKDDFENSPLHCMKPHICQSGITLSNQQLEAPYRTPHDHLDDLESFFWILVSITMSNEIVENKDTTSVIPLSFMPKLQVFETDARSAAITKFGILQFTAVPLLPEPSWGNTFEDLILEMRFFLTKRVVKKCEERSRRVAKCRPFLTNDRKAQVHTYAAAAKKDYSRFIGFISQAISKLKLERARQDTVDIPFRLYPLR